jgi:cysteine desulfurase / selenocysteine lyase
MSAISTLAPLDVSKLRADFPILSTVIHSDKPLVYLDNAATTQRPRQVIQSLVDVYEQHYANVHRGIHWLSEQSTDLYEQARESVRRFINARSLSEIIFTTGTTASINTVARSWGDANVGPGDEIVLTEMEHHSNIVPWQQLAERTGCTIRWVPVTDDFELDLEAFDRILNERTKLVAVTAISNVLGTINPIPEIVRRSHSAGALVLVDAAQSAPHDRTDVQAWDADFVAFSGHKMMGPSGVGVLYGRQQLLEAMPAFMGGGSMIDRVTLEGFTPADIPAKFEAGTPPIVPALGLRTAIDYLEAVGIERIKAHEHTLTVRAHELLGDVEGVTILGPSPDRKAGIVTFVVDGVHAHEIAQGLDLRGVAIRAGHHCAMPLHKRFQAVASNRASFYLYNTLEEVEKMAAALPEIRAFFRSKKRTRKPSLEHGPQAS